jgi:ribonucleoside-diphosphate reductase subunit M2
MLKMIDSPAKKLDFSSGNKENVFRPIVGIPDITLEEDASGALPSTAPTIKPEEADEPLLRENSQRFVMFPIKYHDVSAIHVFDACLNASNHGSRTHANIVPV